MKKATAAMNTASLLMLDKEIISKADAFTIENLNGQKKMSDGYQPSLIPTTPTTTADGVKTLLSTI